MNPIEELLSSTEKLLNVSIAIHDWNGLVFGFQGKFSINPRYTSHRKQQVCNLGFSVKCQQHCRDHIKKQLQTGKGSHTFTCWKGLQEIIVPLEKRGEIVGVLFAGIWKNENARVTIPWSELPPAFKEAYNKLDPLSKEESISLQHVLKAVAAKMMMFLDSMESRENVDGRKRQIKVFINANANKKISLKDVAKLLGLSRSRTTHLVKELFGQSFQEILFDERLKRAQALLLASYSRHYRIKEIAVQVGMPDEFYFNKAFKRKYGLSPGKFRKTNLNQQI